MSINYKHAKDQAWAREIRRICHNTCVICKKRATTTHHCVSRRIYPEYRWDWRGGIALCEDCHVFIHKDEGTELREKIARNFLKAIGQYAGGQYYFKPNDQKKVRPNAN